MTLYLAYLALALSPDTPALVKQLSSPSFHTREAADKALRKRMSLALAVRLDRVAPTGPEMGRRLSRMVEGYYGSAIPTWMEMPYLDTLTEPSCSGTNNRLTRHYWHKANGAGLMNFGAGVKWPGYRAGTQMLLADLKDWRVPPALVRILVGWMQARSRLYDPDFGK